MNVTKQFTVLNTRPAHQSQHLSQLLKASSMGSISFPTLEIKPTDSETIKKACAQLYKVDIAIFVSANAAYCSFAHWPNPFPVPNILAIGTGTAKTLQDYGLSRITLPNTMNSDGLLDLPILQSITDKTIMIFCGENSKPTLQNTLHSRGANILICESYRRQCPKPSIASLTELENNSIDCVISTSSESLMNLETLLTNVNKNLKNKPIVVISAGMHDLAKQFGWETIVLAENASDAAIVKSITELKPH